jgi:hypothetical protein
LINTPLARHRGHGFELFARLPSRMAHGATVIALLCVATVAYADASGQPKILTLSLVNGVIRDVGDTVKVKQGDQLELRWSSDKPMQLHLHGYDIEVKVSPQAPAVMAFKANLPGRFPIEPHGQGSGPHHPILYLEVYP